MKMKCLCQTTRPLLVCLTAGWLSFVSPLWASDPTLPATWERFPLVDRDVRVIDGDTFDVDLNGDGRLEKKTERVRLLFVDTPELSHSLKGQDRRFGLPAKAALGQLLQSRNALWVNPEEPKDRYGRWLGLVELSTGTANLELIRDGHSYFDTRFSLPHPVEAYEAYARAELRAFDLGAGIWSTRESKKRYLLRLQEEGKTVYSTRNPLFRIQVLTPEEVDPEVLEGRFIRVEGIVQRARSLRYGAALLFLRHAHSEDGLPVFLGKRQREWFPASMTSPGAHVQVEGFLQHYQSRQWQIRLHRLVASP